MKKSIYADMSHEDFERILQEVMDKDPASALLDIPGVYEAVSEHFNNLVLERWAEENGVEEDGE